MKLNGSKKSWGAMTAEELAEATKEFDKPLPLSRMKPLTKAERARFERARHAGDRGRAMVRALGLNSNLLGKAESYAKRKNLTFTQLVEQSLRHELAGRK